MARAAVLTVADTIANSFIARRGNARRPAAIREKKFGIWHPTSWGSAADIQGIAYGCTPSGFVREMSLDHCERGAGMGVCRHGILCAGGVSSGIYRPIPRPRWNISLTTPRPG